MFVEGLKIEQKFSPQDLKGREMVYVNDGTRYVDMEIGIIQGTSNTMDRVSLRVPAKALTNGKSIENRRGTRLTHFLNVINAFADNLYNLRDDEQVVFIRFLT
jgi:hypothetical protein